MGYSEALNLAWEKLDTLKKQNTYAVRFLADEYSVDTLRRSVDSLSCNTTAPVFIAILVLHYLLAEIKGLPQLTERWISFPELEGGKGYLPTFKKRALDPIIRKYGKNPEGLLSVIERFSAKKIQVGDIGIVLEAFIGVPVMITFWKADEEFSAEANMLFDANIKDILSTEDIVVMAGFIAASI